MKSPSEPLLLALDSANQRCSVAIGQAGRILAQAEVETGYRHAEMLTVLIAVVLKTADLKLSELDALVLSAGPGSYTGLRIGASVAKGICYGSGLPLVAIDTLEMMARGYVSVHGPIFPGQLLVPMIDARRDEVFTAVFDDNFNQRLASGALVLTPQAYADFAAAELVFFGSGAPKFQPLFQGKGVGFEAEGHEHAKHLLLAGTEKLERQQTENVAYFKPDYRKAFFTLAKKGQV